MWLIFTAQAHRASATKGYRETLTCGSPWEGGFYLARSSPYFYFFLKVESLYQVCFGCYYFQLKYNRWYDSHLYEANGKVLFSRTSSIPGGT